MKWVVEDRKLNKFCNLAEDVAEVFLRKINNNFVIEAKIEKLEVIFISTQEQIDGMYKRKGKAHKIVIAIPEGTKDIEFEIVFSHELAHLAFDNFSNMKDYCETDKSYAITNIIRKEKEVYGRALEEGCANFIALTIASILNNISYNDAKAFLPKGISLKELDISERIINMFSKEPFKKDDYFDQMIILDENYQTQKNCFLSEAISGGCMSSVITDYDDYMGNGSWKRLMHCLDVFSADNESKDSLSYIESEISLFYMREKIG